MYHHFHLNHMKLKTGVMEIFHNITGFTGFYHQIRSLVSIKDLFKNSYEW